MAPSMTRMRSASSAVRVSLASGRSCDGRSVSLASLVLLKGYSGLSADHKTRQRLWPGPDHFHMVTPLEPTQSPS